MKATILRIVALVVILSMVVTPVNAMGSTWNETARTRPGGPTFKPAAVTPVGIGIVKEPKGAVGPEIYTIRLTDVPLAGYTGGVKGLAATSPTATGKSFNLKSAASLAYAKHLESKHADFQSQAEKALGRKLDVVYDYKLANNGLAVRMTPEEAAKVAKIPGVVLVQRDFEHKLDTDAGPGWIGAKSLWDGSYAAGGVATKGEGIVVGVIDTGINYGSPSFAAVGPVDGYAVQNPLGTGNFLGDCAPGAATPHAYCNDKLIGVHGYLSNKYAKNGDPVDYDGHGSHTASTAAGNVVDAHIATSTVTARVSGVAPHANVIAYAACCSNASLVAAMEDVLNDYAALTNADPDVRMAVNYSIGSSDGSPSPDPWTDWDTVAFLNMRAAGIVVANSAGNSGPNAATLGSPADAPWILSVAASTHNRVFINQLVNMTGVANAPADITGKGFSGGVGPATIVYAGDYGNALCGPFPANTFHGEIVVCDRGTVGRVAKGQNVLDAGGGGMVLANDALSGDSLIGDVHVLPAVHITYNDGVALKAWLASGNKGDHKATITGSTADLKDSYGDVMASFSSRGPNRSVPDLIAPAVSAPGVDILAAYGVNNATYYGFESGTSMASPHVAGASALMLAIHPDWTPAEIQSALMTTAKTTMFKEDGVTPTDPFDMGAGRVDLANAAKAGLVLDETRDNYLASDPAAGGDVKTLNLAQFGNSQCLITCTWTRTLRNTLSTTANWTASVEAPEGMTLTVTPDTFSVNAGETATITVTADVTGLPANQWAFATVKLTEDAAQAPAAHFPVAVNPSTGVLPPAVDIQTHRNAGSQVVKDVQALQITEFTARSYGFNKAETEIIPMVQDPTNDDPFDNLSQVYYKTFDVPAGAKRMVANVFASTASDVDLYWGTGSTPSVNTVIGSSATSSWNEYLSMLDPEAGTYWVLVQDWAGSTDASAKDTIKLALGVVTGDQSNMTVKGPATQPAQTPFDLTIAWDIPEMTAGDHYYGAFDLGTDAAHPGNIGTVPVDLVRLADDVTKTVDKTNANVGDTLTYTITVQPNTTDSDQSYAISDKLPDGVVYVPDSVTGGATYDAATNSINWSGTLTASGRYYAIATSKTDPDNCYVPYANSGAYTNLEAYKITTDPAVLGDGIAYRAFNHGPTNTIPFYGKDYDGLYFTDDGYVTFSSGTPDYGNVGNTDLPNSAAPNNLIGIDWRNWKIVYDQATNKGVTTADLTANDGTPLAAVLEYDDVQPVNDPAHSMDYEMFITRYVDDTPGAYEIVTAYDNINLTDAEKGTVGVENATGTEAAKFGYNDLALENGMAVCYDYTHVPVEPQVITFKAVVADSAKDTKVTNTATHTLTSDPYAKPAEASATTKIYADPTLNSADLPGPYKAGAQQEFTVSLSNVGGINYQKAVINFAITATKDQVTSLQYYDPISAAWFDLPTMEADGQLVGVYGDPAGSILPAGVTTAGKFRVTFAKLGQYPVTFTLVDLDNPTVPLAVYNDVATVKPVLLLPFVYKP